MVFREQEAQDLCSVCRELATEHCLRCKTPFCERHKPPLDQRCSECESQFLPVAQKHAAQMTRIRGWQRPLLMTGAAMMGLISIIGAITGVWTSMVIAAFAGLQLVRWESTERREHGEKTAALSCRANSDRTTRLLLQRVLARESELCE